MVRIIYIAFFALFTIGALHGKAVIAQEINYYPIGLVAAIEGEAFTHNNEKRSKAKIDDPIFLGTIIETSANSKIMVLFIDDTEITLGENTELVVDKYVFDPYDAEENIANFDVMKGAFHWVSGMISKRERPQVRITTQAGSIGIRGTEFWAGDVGDGYGLFVNNGLIDFAGSWGELSISANTGVFVKPDAPDSQLKEHYWTSDTRQSAQIRTTIKMVALSSRIDEMRKNNIQKRHDWRGRMFPHKPNPYMNLKRSDGVEKFYTDEFEEEFDYNKNKP